MSDLIPTRDRIMALLSPPSQDVWLTVDDARWIKAEIERLRDALERIAEGCDLSNEAQAMAREALCIKVQKGTAADIKRNLNINDDDFRRRPREQIEKLSGDARQCKGKTLSGKRCQRMILFFDYCPDHYGQRNA